MKPQKKSTVSVCSRVSDELPRTCTPTYKASRSAPDRPGLHCARRPHIHPSALYCSFHCGNGKSQCGTEGGGNGGQDPRALQGPATVGITLLTHTFTHGRYHTQPGFTARSGGSPASAAVLKTRVAPASLQIVGNPRHADHI